MPENGNGNGEDEKPNIGEIASRWYNNAPKEASEDQQPSPSENLTIGDDVVSYTGGGNLYIPFELQEKLGAQQWDHPIHFPVEYDADAGELIISLEPVDVEDASEDSDDDPDTLVSDGGGLSDIQMAELISDLRKKRGGSR